MSESNAGTSAARNTKDREIVLTRVFDAPRELVFKAWTEPKLMAQWWGRRDFQIPFASWTPGSVVPGVSSCALLKAWNIHATACIAKS